MAKDILHDAIRLALEKEDWKITHDPLSLKIDGIEFRIDLGAERLLAAEKQGRKIAVEIKSFVGKSEVNDFHLAIGQTLNYRSALRKKQPDRVLYLAVTVDVYSDFFPDSVYSRNNCRTSTQNDRCKFIRDGGCFMEGMNYSELVKIVLERHTANDLSDDTEVELIFDTERERYLLVHLGWENQERVYGCVVHVDIKDGKIWIQRDLTEVGIANELVELGVPQTNIVLGFRSPYRRQCTGFAVA